MRSGGYSLVPEDTPREDGSDWRAAFLHLADLHAAGVSSEEDVRVGVDEESVLHIPCRVLRREVERREDVPVVFDFRAFGDGEAEPGEDFDYLVLDDGDWVSSADGRRCRRACDVDGLLGSCLRHSDLFLEEVDSLLCDGLEFVEAFAEVSLHVRVNVLELFE